MTCLAAPYEEPESPTVLVETDKAPLEQCMDQIVQFLIEKRIVIRRQSF